MTRKSSLTSSVLALALALAASAPAFAKNPQRVTLQYDMVLNGTHLSAGDYMVAWERHTDAATITFTKSKQVVATAQAKLVDRGTKYRRNSVVFNALEDGTRVIQEIRPAGESQAIVFSD